MDYVGGYKWAWADLVFGAAAPLAHLRGHTALDALAAAVAVMAKEAVTHASSSAGLMSQYRFLGSRKWFFAQRHLGVLLAQSAHFPRNAELIVRHTWADRASVSNSYCSSPSLSCSLPAPLSWVVGGVAGWLPGR